MSIQERPPGPPPAGSPQGTPAAPPGSAVDDPLGPYRATPIHLFIYDKMLREQLRLIFAALKFEQVIEHSPGSGYLESVKLLAQLLLQKNGLILVNPPQAAVSQGGKVRVAKDVTDFFASLKVLLGKARREEKTVMAKCVPVFQDIQFPQKRELTILQLARFGVAGAFILNKQESLGSLSPQLRKIRMQEQVMERYHELREYLQEFLPQLEEAGEMVQERLEEIELSERKAKADAMCREAERARDAKDWERAVLCYKRAIDLYPQDPIAYLESGRVYVRLRKYPRALLRFGQAEEVAEFMPEPNKEIGMVRVLQVQERLEQGDSPSSPEVLELLNDALANFEIALQKARQIKPLAAEEEDAKRSREVVARIAGELMKLDLKASLGKGHPMVKSLGALARAAIEDVAPENVDQLPAPHLIFLGLAALDSLQFDEAERLLFRAAQDKEYFQEACSEIIYMGTVARKSANVAKAIEIYRRLLQLDPPRKAAVHYNLAVAYCAEKRDLEGAGAIVQALYLDPSLPDDEAFYRNAQLHEVLARAVSLFQNVDKRARRVAVPELVQKAVSLQEDLERAILAGEDTRALRLLWHIASQMPDFMERELVMASKTLTEFMQRRVRQLQASSKAGSQFLGNFFQRQLTLRSESKLNKRLIAFLRYKSQALRAKELEQDESAAAGWLTKALLCHPEIINTAEFYASTSMLALTREISTRLGRVKPERIGLMA
ncbi:tetratricopeptide repeat protein [Megalodesulfovibrio paquesii]